MNNVNVKLSCLLNDISLNIHIYIDGLYNNIVRYFKKTVCIYFFMHNFIYYCLNVSLKKIISHLNDTVETTDSLHFCFCCNAPGISIYTNAQFVFSFFKLKALSNATEVYFHTQTAYLILN